MGESKIGLKIYVFVVEDRDIVGGNRFKERRRMRHEKMRIECV